MILDEIVRRYENNDRGITHLLAAMEGSVIAEWYRDPVGRAWPHMLHSATKSFINTAIGLALDDGKLNLDDKLIDFLTTDQKHIAADGLEAITISDMLTMRTGHTLGTSGVAWRILKTSWIEDYLHIPVTGRPGTDFIYSSGTSHMLSMVLQKATGQAVDEYLRPRLFEPLGFSTPTWDKDPEGICSGGNGLTITIADFLKWGQLYLNGGTWNGQRILPEFWVKQSLTRQVDVGSLVWTGDSYGATDAAAGDGEGYGYQIWHRPGGNYASGLFGQECVIVPATQTVIAVYSSLQGKDPEPLSAALVAAGNSPDLRSFVPPLSGGFDLADELGDETVVRASLVGTFASTDGSTRLTLALNDGAPHRPVGPPITSALGSGSNRSDAVLSVIGHDVTGRVEFCAGLDHDHWFAGDLAAPSLHHSYTEPTHGIGHLSRRGPWRCEAKIVYPLTSFVDRYTFELVSDGVIRYVRSVNVNSQDTSIDEVILTRAE